MASNHPPFYDRILFKLLLPVIIVGITCSTLVVAYMSAPMKAFLTRQFDANLQTASVMGLRVCEESLTYLLDLRLEKNLEMNQVLQNEALEKMNAIASQFPQIHLLVLQSGQILNECHIDDVPEGWHKPVIAGQHDTAMVLDFDGRTVRSHVQFFPFWDWHIVSMVFEQDYQYPIRMAYTVTYLSAAGAFCAVVITLLAVYYQFISKPLTQLVNATDGVAEGRFSKIDSIARDEFGRLMDSFNAMVDSLEKEKAEVRSLIHQLSESEALFRSQFEFGNIGIAIVTTDGRWIRANKRLCRMLGYSEVDLYQKAWMDLFHRQDLEIGLVDFKRMLAGEIESYEVDTKLVHKQEKAIYSHISVSCIRETDGSVKFVIASILDITDRKKADQEVRHLRNYLSNIFNSMPSVLVGVDSQVKVTQWNRQAEQVTGVGIEKARSRPLGEVFPRLLEEMEHIRTAIREHRVIRDPKVPREHPDETRFEDVTIYPLVSNGVEGAVIRVDDVTDRVRLEEMMIQSEKMLSVGGLAAGMAHEINNPLSGILQSAAVVENRLMGDMEPNHKAAETAGTTMASIRHYLELRKLPGMLKNIHASGSVAAAIVKNMLSFSRKSERMVSSHDIGSLLDQTLDLLKTDYDMKKQYDFKQIQLVREYSPGAAVVPCEAGKLQQVFMNILKNGAEAMAGAEGSENPHVFVLRVQDDAHWVRVEIEDNGPGMEEKVRRRIFEPFFTTKPVGKGTGLGLSVSYFIITEDHGGEMGVHATDSGGTRFVIRLPKAGRE